MNKPVKSQWDFGELFPLEPRVGTIGRKLLSVGELTSQIRRLLEQHVGQVWVTGEVTNLRVQSSGHIYFTLKDAVAQLSCVLFRGESQVDRAFLQDGRKINVHGELTVYEVRGQYQLRVTAIELEGVGALQAAFEKLKQKLAAEGLFAQSHKRALPPYPQRIGLVTSPTGAAIRDVLYVVKRRNPSLEIIFAPCRVQGEGASAEMAAAIRLLNEFNASHLATCNWLRPMDLILLTRGGGSLEDLWAFNEEILARAIFASMLPVISAVGHEIDFTISDFVADLRAATPSAAAEIITEGVFSSCQFVAEAAGRLGQLAKQQLEDKKDVLDQSAQRLGRMHPRRRVNEDMQRLDDLQAGMLRCLRQGVRRERLAWRNLAERLGRVRPATLLKQRRELFHQTKERLREQARHRLREWKNRLTTLDGRLRLLGPEQVLGRGYSITCDAKTGKVLREAGQVEANQRLRTRLKNGEIFSKAEATAEAVDAE